MRRQEPDASHSSLLRKLDTFARSRGVSLHEESTQDQLLGELRKALIQHRGNPIRLHGFRAESMFGHVAAALGKAQVITEEDAGIFFHDEPDMRRPDFRLSLRDGTQMLIEVKNFHPKSSSAKYRLSRTYVAALRQYASALRIPAKLAVFWSHMHLWTLTDLERMKIVGGKVELSLADALLENEMNVLGDYMVGTVLPLTFRLYADVEKPRAVLPNGEAPFTIGGASLLAAGREVTRDIEKQFTWFLINYGPWDEADWDAKITDSRVDYLDFTVSKGDVSADGSDVDGFSFVGFVSQMISSQYIAATSGDEGLRSLLPSLGPDRLGISVPSDYKGEVLKLWRFHVQPKSAVA